MAEMVDEFLKAAFIFFDQIFWQGFLSNLFATLIGIIFGIPVALWISNFQEKEAENTRRAKILSTIWKELDRNRLQLEHWSRLNPINKHNEIWSLCIRLREESWNVFSQGGEMEWIKNRDLLYAISESYFASKRVKQIAEKYYDMATKNLTTTSSDNLKRLFQALIKSVDYASKSSIHSMQLIENALK